MPVKVYDGANWVTVAGDGQQGSAATSSSISTWVKTASGGETSVSGTGDTGYGTLAYTVGQELVYLNGVLLDRSDDYTATNGTSITGLTALAANDVITVWTVNSFSVANTYTQAQSDSRYPAKAGSVLQVLSTTKTDTFSASITAGSNAAVTGLSQTITPSSATSKFLVTLTINGFNLNYAGFSAGIARGSTLIGIGDAAGSRLSVGSGTSIIDINHIGTVTCQFLDSPSTTSAVTYNGYVFNSQSTTRTVVVNRTDADTSAVDFLRTASTITVMEIGA
jgi:hypothetical protein